MRTGTVLHTNSLKNQNEPWLSIYDSAIGLTRRRGYQNRIKLLSGSAALDLQSNQGFPAKQSGSLPVLLEQLRPVISPVAPGGILSEAFGTYRSLQTEWPRRNRPSWVERDRTNPSPRSSCNRRSGPDVLDTLSGKQGCPSRSFSRSTLSRTAGCRGQVYATRTAAHGRRIYDRSGERHTHTLNVLAQTRFKSGSRLRFKKAPPGPRRISAIRPPSGLRVSCDGGTLQWWHGDIAD
jgi:hypothetical protein